MTIIHFSLLLIANPQLPIGTVPSRSRWDAKRSEWSDKVLLLNNQNTFYYADACRNGKNSPVPRRCEFPAKITKGKDCIY